jgi:hypothetical protein
MREASCCGFSVFTSLFHLLVYLPCLIRKSLQSKECLWPTVREDWRPANSYLSGLRGWILSQSHLDVMVFLADT